MTAARSTPAIRAALGTFGRAVAFIGVLAGARMLSAAAEIPGDELPTLSRARQEFLKVAFTDVKKLLADLQPSGVVDVLGTFVVVCYLDGRRWKIRSFVERPGA